MASLQAASWALLLAVAFGSNSLLDNDAQVISLEEDMDGTLSPPQRTRSDSVPPQFWTRQQTTNTIRFLVS